MLDIIKPMLLKEAAPFDSPEYIFEFKLDGWRAIAYLEEGGTVLYSRNGRDISGEFAGLMGLHTAVRRPCILDGEIISPKGFWAVRGGVGVTYAAFDILSANGERLTGLPLIERKGVLRDIAGGLTVCPYIEREGKALFGVACANNLEGIIAKRKAGQYYAGKRSGEWLKIKNGGYVRI